MVGLELARKLVKDWLTYHFDESSGSKAKVDVISEYERKHANGDGDVGLKGQPN